MKINGDLEKIDLQDPIVNGETRETVKNLISLQAGATLTNDCEDSKEIRRKLVINRSAMISLSIIWKDRALHFAGSFKF